MRKKTKPKPAPGHPGDRIRAARLAAGLSQVQLAARLGIEQPNLSRIERGSCGATLERLHEIALAIGCPPSRLDERLSGGP